ncbi:DNA-binding MarR family transcriptional regulator [Kribbella amoyensis]|uniref:DNA-binding MarR family transcriptional regulator n=1 Tax=Kribbella amoyensis TaxID=996641 RepID=A0A561C036_9ACTN|nr:DNA-binding MarR family transcriptional regulator [Kribbella amoyensis]
MVEELSLAMAALTLKAMSASSQLPVLQLRVLLAIDRHGPVSLGELAAELDLSLPSASRLVTRLADERLVLRRVPEHDRRLLRLTLAARGRTTLARLRDARREELDQVLARMSAADRTALVRGLTSFAKASEH